LLRIAKAIDALNTAIGKTVYWLILLSVLVSAGNAVVRYTFSNSSNAWLESQWYMFAAVFLLCAGYTLSLNEHIRIDIVAGQLSRRAQTWIDIVGDVFFLLPMALIIMWLSLPMVIDSYVRNELSSDAGGLIRWPVKILIPIGFALLALQGVAQFIKRIAFLSGAGPDPGAKAQDGAMPKPTP
jgi:TRAP-type mannitol/chloroaromatic compound transport system permease small subunit